MFLLSVIDESQQNSSLLTFGNGVSVTTVLCVVVVTVSLVLMTLLCVCLKRTSASGQITAEQPLVAVVADAPLSSSQLQLVTTGSEDEVKENTNHVTSDRNSNEVKIALSEGASSSTQVSMQQFLVAQESTSQRDSSPQLPPRNPHRLLSGQSSYPGNPGQLGSATVVASGLIPTAEVKIQTETLQAVPEIVVYEEVDFRPNSVTGQRLATVADRQYDYIDLKVVKTADDSGASPAGVGENSGSSASSSRADAAVASGADSDAPRYAKVDKARDRHTFSAALLGNASAKAANSEVEVAGSLQRKDSSSIAALYTEVNKPKSVGTARPSENAAPSELHGEKFLSEDAGGACAGPRPLDNSSNFDGPGYATIKDESKKTFEEPGYSTIKDEPKQHSDNPDYSVIGEGSSGKSPRSELGRVISEHRSDNSQNDGAAANPLARGSTVAASASFSREPLYEDIKFDKS